ncbi:MAG TPA: hypothetical protein D7I01_06145 [Candidatus Poseidoniales archaeon]|nr:MAG TPA: hypothetical protein D7I01_06145 [Candidatus Poseidoniales archaeon]
MTGSKIARKTVDVDGSSVLERRDDRAKLHRKGSVVDAETQEDFLRCGLGGFHTVGAVNDETPFAVNDDRRGWPGQGHHDKFARAYTTKVGLHTALVDGLRGDEANEAVFHPNVDSFAHLRPPRITRGGRHMKR